MNDTKPTNDAPLKAAFIITAEALLQYSKESPSIAMLKLVFISEVKPTELLLKVPEIGLICKFGKLA